VLILMGVEKENGSEQQQTDRDERKWTWWPTWYELRTHYFKEVGFLACLSQMMGATVFVSCSFTVLPVFLSRLMGEIHTLIMLSYSF
jgi:hypothetical protein